jgi:hypothetical protein
MKMLKPITAIFVANIYYMHNQKSLRDSYSLTTLIGHSSFVTIETPDIRRIPALLDVFAMQVNIL